MITAYLGLGSNLGDRAANIRTALSMIGDYAVIEKVSSLYETEPVGFADQPKFLNAACRISTGLAPQQFLAKTKHIEADMGRKKSFRNGPRIIDIDILLYDAFVLHTDELTIPHPRLQERAFVLVPLAEIASGVEHPVIGQTIAELLEAIDPAGVVRYTEKV